MYRVTVHELLCRHDLLAWTGILCYSWPQDELYEFYMGIYILFYT